MNGRYSVDVLTSRIASSLFRRNAATAIAPRSVPTPPKHNLILYDFEASPWCRLVREQLTIMDLNVQIRPCPRQDLFVQGAFTNQSRFRSMAWNELLRNCNKNATNGNQQRVEKQQSNEESTLTFPILVDETTGTTSERVVIKESYDIIEHLWKKYGQDVMIPSQTKRPDQVVNSSNLPFPFRFLLLSGPSYLRCLPRCGLFRMPSKDFDPASVLLTLYQAEGCPYSRLVRELLCSLELPYNSISCARGSSSDLPSTKHGNKAGIPTLVVEKKTGKDDGMGSIETTILVGHEDSLEFVCDKFWDSSNSKQPMWWDHVPPQENDGQNNDLKMYAYLAFLQGRRTFVPPIAQE